MFHPAEESPGKTDFSHFTTKMEDSPLHIPGMKRTSDDGLVKSPSAALRGNPAPLDKDLGSLEE
jgi:hypothetical protein